MLSRIINPNCIGNFHYFVCNKVSNTPTFVNCELLQVWHQLLIDLITWKCSGKVNTTVNTLHSNTVLLVLVEIAENLEQVLLRNVRNQLYHIIYHERSTFSDLGNLILRGLHE